LPRPELGRRLALRLPLLWVLLLLLPALTSFSSLHAWDVDPQALLLVSGWLIVVALLLLPPALFYALSLPLAAFGVAASYAHASRQIDLLELLSQWRQFKPQEWLSALQPYALELLLVPTLLALLAGACWHWGWRPARRPLLLCAASGLLLALWAPSAVWPRAWPANLLLLGISQLPGGQRLVGDWAPHADDDNPRGDGRSWQPRRLQAAPQPETYVLVIGESLRADFLGECGGRWKVRAAAPDALLACDTTAGSNATHTSVPLLIGRDAPGGRYRVPRDSSFISAFAELGFETHWLAQHGRAVAWPEALHQVYPTQVARDREQLLPLLEQALARPAPRKLVVLHADNAHAPYCGKFRAAEAPHAVDCGQLGDLPDATTLPQFRAAYANAVDESMAFVNAVVERLRTQPGEVFVAFTPDHGENLLDDRRQLYQHALRHPSRWDIQVPMLFWANPAWRQRQPQAWAQLQANRDAPLMHADLVPTLLGAAGIQYVETRDGVVNLLAKPVATPRRRLVQRSLGATTDWETLLHEVRP